MKLEIYELLVFIMYEGNLQTVQSREKARLMAMKIIDKYFGEFK